MIKICVYCCLLSALSVVEVKTLYINGRVGESVHFTCSGWDSVTSVRENDKYFCYSPCTDKVHIINKAAFKRTTYKGRVELTNSGESLFVTFKNLHESDSGTYYCGVDRWGKDSFIEVNLKVTDAKSSSPKTTPKPLIVSTLSFSAPYSSTTSSDSTRSCAGPDGVYQSLHPVTMDEDQVYSTITTTGESAGPDGVYQSLHPVTMDEDQVYSTITTTGENAAVESMEMDTTSGS
ncbi:CMRF35-like molecule 9 [Centropristis striata]|uniref:CMRF35-like molecule 9 n=1 Tax=Centropristis striata TaxID=184440 RepID=UPI0027E11E27|nr:CMRF35-like molecule 9 [Centropristis striata]